MRLLRSSLDAPASVAAALLVVCQRGPGADHDHHRQDHRRHRPPYPVLRRDGQGLLQRGRSRRPLGRAGRHGDGPAGLTGNLDFVPIPSGGAQAVLKGGADIRYVVNQSLSSQYVFVARPDISKPQDLKGKTIGFGRTGAADYDEGATVLSRFFQMQVGKDYKVISFQGETERIAALVNNDIEAALISAARRMRSRQCRHEDTAAYRRSHCAGGRLFWITKAFATRIPDTVKVHPRHRKGRDVLPRQQGGLAQHPQGASRRRRRQACRPDLGRDAQYVRRRAAQGPVSRDLRIRACST